MRSVVVVLPASMWAMMPMFLQRSNGTVLGTTVYSFWGSKIQTSFSLLALKLLAKPLSMKPRANRQRPRADLPPVMREGLVGFRHAVNIFFLLNGCAFSIGGVQQFVAQLVDHAALGAAARVGQQPADRKRSPPVGIHFHRNLVVRAAHAPGLHFQQRLGILDGFCKQLQSFVAAFFLHLGQGFIKDALGG